MIFLFQIAYIFSILTIRECKHSTKTKTSRDELLIRCTRRFTPGMCLEPVESVWTFEFQKQNCTERFGCTADKRTNRFNSYKRCVYRCKSLINLYTEILAHDPANLTTYLRSGNWASSGRRLEIEENYEGDSDEYAEITNQYVDGPAPNPMDDDSSLNHQWTSDIDYIDAEHDDDHLIDHRISSD